MFADRPISSWWTPGRVASALSHYPELATTCEFFAVEATADLDRAIDGLTPHLRAVASRYWREGFDQSEIAHRDRVSQQRVSHIAHEAEEIIAEILCRGVV